MRGKPVILSIALALCLGGCSDVCSNTLISQQADLEGSLVAYLFTRDCGATTDFSTNIAIGRKGAGLSNARTVFTADSDHGAATIEGDTVWTRMSWAAPHRLQVAYDAKARVFRADESMGKARIAYRTSAPLTLPAVD
jgi:hypothetical protein